MTARRRDAPPGQAASRTGSASSTVVDVRDTDRTTVGHRIRQATVIGLAALVVLGLLGAFGVRTGTASAEGSGYELSVRYARVSRAGLDTPWTVTVRHAGGFDGPITLATTADYFTMFEAQGFSPEPDAETAGRYLYQTFAAPPGDTFTVSFDAYVQPASQRGRRARTALVVGGREVARVGYRTRLVP